MYVLVNLEFQSQGIYILATCIQQLFTNIIKSSGKSTFLDVVVAQGTAILKLFAGKNQPLLIWGDTLFILDLGLDILDGIWSLNL